MVYILDDSITINKRAESIAFLKEKPYCDFCMVIERPQLDDLRHIIANVSGTGDLLCIHKSLKIYTDNDIPFDNSDKLRESLLMQVKEKTGKCVIFSRDVIANENTLYIDKDIFYCNFGLFLDKYISDHSYDFSILFHGLKASKINRMKLFHSIYELLCDYGAPKSSQMEELLQQFIPEEKEKVQNIISELNNNQISPKQVKDYLESMI